MAVGVIEAQDLPFDIRRIYYLHDVPTGAVRGEHGHKLLEQMILCMHGQVEVILNDGTRQFPFTLTNASTGLYLPPGLWRRLRFLMPKTVVCVIASRPYENSDDIDEFEDFLHGFGSSPTQSKTQHDQLLLSWRGISLPA